MGVDLCSSLPLGVIMDKMTIEKAKDILREYPEHQAWEDEQFYQVLCLKGFIEGYESRDAEVVLLKSEVEELKKLVEYFREEAR